MKSYRKTASLIIVWVLLFATLAACSGVPINTPATTAKVSESTVETSAGSDVPDYMNAEGFPIVKKPITMKAMVNRHAVQPPWNDILVWQEYEKMTGIKMEWEEVTSELAAKRSLALASGEYPDIFYRANVSDAEIIKYGAEGVFLSLGDLIDKYAPNYKKFLNENPDAKKGITMADGNMYSLLYYMDVDANRITPKLFFNQEWLNRVGKSIPTTTEEFYALLKAFKDGDGNGNGKDDEIPWAAQNLEFIVNSLYGAWGLRNRGASHPYVDMDEQTGKLRFIPIQNEYKEMLQYLNKLYTEKLVDQEIFTMNIAQLVAKGEQDLVGVFSHTNNQQIGSTASPKFVGQTEALEGPNGHKLAMRLSNVAHKGAFLITDKCKYPEAAMRWVDYFYSMEGGYFLFLGVEGVSYEKKADGTYDFYDKIVKEIPAGSTYDQVISAYVPIAGLNNPTIGKREYFRGAVMNPVGIGTAENLAPYVPKEIWAPFNYSLQDMDRLAALEGDIKSYIDQMQAQFIQGKASFADWDKYVSEIKKMGLEEYMEIYNIGYENYKK